jgi:dihydroorotate dehydrogenase electron transfer subunit
MQNIFNTTARVLSKEQLALGIFRLKLFCEEIASSCKPGQFVHVECGEGRDFILRRPFSIHRKDGGGAFEILFQVVGKGTKALSNVQPREVLSLVGPMGNGFSVDGSVRKVILVSGGLGIAPLIFLVDELLTEKSRICVLLGVSNRERLLYPVDLKRLVRKLLIATDDGSYGYKGPVVDLLSDAIEEFEPERIYACGPEVMLHKVATICTDYKIPTQVCLERQMGCGIGACLSCVCKVKQDREVTFKRVCVDGPVFASEDIVWEDSENLAKERS